MKITKKKLQEIIKQELELVILEQKLKEAVPLAVAAAKAAGYIATGLAGEAVFSRLASALGLSEDDSKYLEDLLEKSEERVILHVMNQLAGSEENINKKIKALNNKIEFLEAFIEPPK